MVSYFLVYQHRGELKQVLKIWEIFDLFKEQRKGQLFV